MALVAHDVEEGRVAVPDEGGTSSREFHNCALEVQTPVCPDLDALLGSLAQMRGIAAARAARHGHRVLSAGLHPFADWRREPVGDDDPHYARVVAEFGDIARSSMTFGLHLHYGLPSGRSRMAVIDRLRERLPDVLALSASSPFIDGRDTGTQSWRLTLQDRWPRMGLPGTWGSDAACLQHINRLRKLGVLSADQGLWGDIRLHQQYGTIEVRVCDATPSLNRIWLIAALLLCEVSTLDAEVDSGRIAPALPSELVAENRWRARRFGTAAEFIDWRHDEIVPGRMHYIRWLERLEPVASRLGLMPRLAEELANALFEGTSADRQRAIVARGGSLEDVVRDLVEETAKAVPQFRVGTQV